MFPAPNKPLSLNQAYTMHWAARKRRLDPWGEAVQWAWMQCKQKRTVKRKPCRITVELPFERAARRDPHNYVATVKRIVDALVEVGVWEDDTPDWVAVDEPRLVLGTECRVTLTPTDLERPYS